MAALVIAGTEPTTTLTKASDLVELVNEAEKNRPRNLFRPKRSFKTEPDTEMDFLEINFIFNFASSSSS